MWDLLLLVLGRYRLSHNLWSQLSPCQRTWQECWGNIEKHEWAQDTCFQHFSINIILFSFATCFVIVALKVNKVQALSIEWYYYGMEERQKQLFIFIKYTKRQQQYRDEFEQNFTMIAWKYVAPLINNVSNSTQGENSIQFTNTLSTISILLKLAYPWEILYNFCP